MGISQPDPDRPPVEGESSPPPGWLGWGWLEALVVFALGLIPAAIVQVVAQSQSGAVRTNLIAVSLAYQSLVWAILGVAAARARGHHPRRIGWQVARPAAAVAAGLLGILAAVAAMLATGGIIIAALSLFMSPEEATELLAAEGALQQEQLLPTGTLTAAGATALAVSMCLVPIGEEVMFRGLLHTAVRDRFGLAAAIIVVSAGFALIHSLRYHFLVLFSVGVVLALLRERTGSLLPPIIAHAGLNSVTILIWLLQA